MQPSRRHPPDPTAGRSAHRARRTRGRAALLALSALAACGAPGAIADRGSAAGDGAGATLGDVRCEGPRAVGADALAAGAAPARVTFTVRPVPVRPVGLGTAAAVWTGREHLVLGGAAPEAPLAPGARAAGGRGEWVESPAGEAFSTIGWAFDPARDSWRPLPGAAPAGSSGLDPLAWHCGRAFLLTRSGAGYRYDPETGAIRATSTVGAPSGCAGARISTHGALAFVWGCEGCAAHAYDAAHDTWERLAPGPDVADFRAARCDWSATGVVGDRLVVLRRYRETAGAVWDIEARTWSAVEPDGAPESVHAGPVGDGDVAWVVGQTGPVAGIYRYDLAARRWSHDDLPEGVCNLGSEATLRRGVLLTAGEHAGLPMICGYDLARGAEAGTSPRGGDAAAAVTSFAGDHVFLWAHRGGTGEGDGEMPRMPTHWIENEGRIVTFEIAR